MTNLRQENKEIKSHHTNSTFGFCQHTKNQPQKTKRAVFLPAQKTTNNYKS